METFTLFGQRPFNHYAHNRLKAITKSIDAMSNLEVLLYKNSFEDLVKKLVNAYSLLPVTISFEDKLIDLINRPDEQGIRCFAEYTLMIKGDSALLELDPFNLGYVSLRLPVSVQTNIISFEIDTHQSSENLTPDNVASVKDNYDTIKNFIQRTLLALNNESQKFNLQLEDVMIPILAAKMRSASYHHELKEKLNFK